MAYSTQRTNSQILINPGPKDLRDCLAHAIATIHGRRRLRRYFTPTQFPTTLLTDEGKYFETIPFPKQARGFLGLAWITTCDRYRIVQLDHWTLVSDCTLPLLRGHALPLDWIPAPWDQSPLHVIGAQPPDRPETLLEMAARVEAIHLGALHSPQVPDCLKSCLLLQQGL